MAVTVDQSLKLMWGFPEHLQTCGWDVHVVSSGDTDHPPTYFTGPAAGVTFHRLPMKREISPRHDVRALITWIRLMRKVRPDVAFIGTPKASLLGLASATLTGVPLRIYLLRGLRLEGATGGTRAILALIERLTGLMAHRVVSVSPSLSAVAKRLGIGNAEKNLSIGAGSSNGIQIPAEGERMSDERRRELMDRFGLDPSVPTLGFVGRITPDKGLDDLFDAVRLLESTRLQVLIAGAEDEAGYLAGLQRKLSSLPVSVVFTGYVPRVHELYELMSIFVLPSRREGMPNVSLEAAAYSRPVVTTTATGCVDSVVDGRTGLTYTAGDATALAERLARLLDDPGLARDMGAEGRQWVERTFARPVVWKEYSRFFDSELASRSHINAAD